MRFPNDLEAGAFRSRGGDGEYAWCRLDAERAAEFLAEPGAAILGGELWRVRGREIWPGFVGSDGIPGIYPMVHGLRGLRVVGRLRCSVPC